MSLRSSRSERLLRPSLLALALSGCSIAGRPAFPTASELPEGRRRPDGVAIDPASTRPAPRARASSAETVVTLQTPLGMDRAAATVAEFFRSIAAEDGEALAALFTRDALALTGNPATSQGQSPSAALWWEQRLRRLDYGKLSGELLYRETELELYRAEDTPDVPPHAAVQLDALSADDVLVRVRILTPRIGADRLFGDELLLWLRRDGVKFKIYRLLEDFQL